jgi:hypothetical protein
VVIRGSVLQKGPNSENTQMIGIALEGAPHPVIDTLIEGNLVLFDTVPAGLIQDLARMVGLLPAKGVVVASDSTGEVRLRNNVIVGAQALGAGVSDESNRLFSDRRAAGLQAYPAIPEPAR